MQKADLIRVRHMVEAAREAMTFARGCQLADLAHDRMRVLAIVRCIEIVGEAAGQISREYREASPDVPWAAIVAMRNRLVHAYFDVDLERVLDTVNDDLPQLLNQLEPRLPASQ